MCAIGVVDQGRKGVLIINSWGENWVSGPNRFPDMPVGCFFVDADIVDSMIRQGDSFGIRGFHGYKSYRLW